MNSFDPAPGAAKPFRHPLSACPELPGLRTAASAPSPPSPDDEACFALWRKYVMLPNVQRHSRLVAHIATALARRAAAKGLQRSMCLRCAPALCCTTSPKPTVCATAAATPCGRRVGGGRNPQLRAGSGRHAACALPWPLPEGAGICALPFFVIYADKRVRHDACVPLEERYEDLLARYGRTEAAREGIRGSYEQGKTIERALSAQLGWALHEDSFDCGRLVQ